MRRLLAVPTLLLTLGFLPSLAEAQQTFDGSGGPTRDGVVPVDATLAVNSVSSETMTARDVELYLGYTGVAGPLDTPVSLFYSVGPMGGFRFENSRGQQHNDVRYLGLELRLGLAVYRRPAVGLWGNEITKTFRGRTVRGKQLQAYVFGAGLLVGESDQSQSTTPAESQDALVGYRLGVGASINHALKVRIARAIAGPKSFEPQNAHRKLGALIFVLLPTHVSLFIENMRDTTDRTGFGVGWSF